MPKIKDVKELEKRMAKIKAPKDCKVVHKEETDEFILSCTIDPKLENKCIPDIIKEIEDDLESIIEAVNFLNLPCEVNVLNRKLIESAEIADELAKSLAKKEFEIVFDRYLFPK